MTKSKKTPTNATQGNGCDYILESWWTDMLLIHTNVLSILHLPPLGPQQATRKTPLSTPRRSAINTPLLGCVLCVCVEGVISQIWYTCSHDRKQGNMEQPGSDITCFIILVWVILKCKFWGFWLHADRFDFLIHSDETLFHTFMFHKARLLTLTHFSYYNALN